LSAETVHFQNFNQICHFKQLLKFQMTQEEKKHQHTNSNDFSSHSKYKLDGLDMVFNATFNNISAIS
jgi:hypothetical protein